MEPCKASDSSNIKLKMNHITVFNNIVLAFQSQFAGFFGALFTVVRDKFVVGHYFRFNKAALEVGVDYAGGLRCRGS